MFVINKTFHLIKEIWIY